MVNRQKGFVNLDGIVPILIVFGVTIGVVLCFFLPWVWGLIKPWIHSITG